MAESLDEEEALFSEALAMSANDRRVFLRDLAQKRPECAARIEALLAAHARPEPFPRDALARNLTVPLERIGRYVIGEKLGEGGIGIVYRAEQIEPVRREVALKVIKAGMDTVEIIARFEAERQALALLDHPQIAHLFDAGATPEGRPYFVMELVQGPSLTRYCDERRLPLTERLRLFATICHAVHHAHGRNIIHRDLKPSNILVADCDGQPMPKIIDFGIAKIMDRGAGVNALTVVPQFMGTPGYMSPEQAGDAADVDARTDVYSLGVVLCELLTSRTPLGHVGVNANFEAVRRRIRDQSTPDLVRILDQLDNPALIVAAQLRQTEPALLRRAIAGRLNRIIQRALAPAPLVRHASARALAEDVEQFLGGASRLTDGTLRRLTARAIQWWGVSGNQRHRRPRPEAPPVGMPQAAPRPVHVQAHRLVLEGRRHWQQFTEEGFTRAEEAFHAALQLAPGYAMALAGLAFVSGRRAILSGVASRHIEPTILEAERFARDALTADSGLSDAHAVLGVASLLRGQLGDAKTHLDRALGGDPNSELGWVYLSRLHMRRGRPDLALPAAENASLLTPARGAFGFHRGLALLLARDPAKALTLFEQMDVVGEDTSHTRALSALALLRLGRKGEALTTARRAANSDRRGGWTRGMNLLGDGLLAWALAAAGDGDDANRLLDGITQAPVSYRYAGGFALALMGSTQQAAQVLADVPQWCADYVFLLEQESNCFGGGPVFEGLLREISALDAWYALQRVVGPDVRPAPIPIATVIEADAVVQKRSAP